MGGRRQAPPAGAGFTVWLTGLPGAGKTTVATLVAETLERGGRPVDVLDGDEIRSHVSSDLSFSRDDRRRNVDRIAWIASRLARAGAATIVAAVSPYESDRRRARAFTERFAPFFEVFVDAPLALCVARDPKGLYARALAGTVPEFTGISAPYEPPSAPDLVLRTGSEPAEASARRLLAFLAGRTARTAPPREAWAPAGRDAWA